MSLEGYVTFTSDISIISVPYGLRRWRGQAAECNRDLSLRFEVKKTIALTVTQGRSCDRVGCRRMISILLGSDCG
jgi:hypothetical protein